MKIQNTKHQILNTKNILLIALFLTAFAERVFFDLGPNIELVTAAMILSAYYLGVRQSLLLVIAIMVVTDSLIGNTNIFIFTWSGFLIPALFLSGFINILKKLIKPYLVRRSQVTKKMFTGVSLMSAGLSANIFFFLWTNFGVWLLSGMYSKTFAGLITSYINALPFLRYQFISTLVFVPLGYILSQITISIIKNTIRSTDIFSPLNKRSL